LGGSQGRTEATGRGVVIATLEALRKLGRDPKQVSVAIQGAGNVGSHAADILANEVGCKIVAISDVSAGVYNADGLDINSILAHTNPPVSQLLSGLNHNQFGEHITNEELLTLDVDVLIPAAIENQITERNADLIRADVIVEGANGPTTHEGDLILIQRGKLIVPDILANAGGVICSYFEWVQDLQSFFWDIDEVRTQINRSMVKAFDEVWSLAQYNETDMRTAAYLLAVQRVADAIQQRGLFP
jgi:glutamate dehydrogenase (NAD(P)+)